MRFFVIKKNSSRKGAKTRRRKEEKAYKDEEDAKDEEDKKPLYPLHLCNFFLDWVASFVL
jgi:hypothetical protein